MLSAMVPRSLAAMLILVACFVEEPHDDGGDASTSGSTAADGSTTATSVTTTDGSTTTGSSSAEVTADATSVANDDATTGVDGSTTDATGSATTEATGDTGLPSEHRIFTTSLQFFGNEITSLETADFACEDAISDGGVWLAVLWDSQTAAPDRIQIGGPVYNMNDELVAADKDELWSGVAQAIVGYDESGMPIGVSDLAWVGNATSNCSDWTSANGEAQVGLPTQADVWLDTQTPFMCQFSLHIYCISQ
jgi:hypothetical protein